MAQEQLPHFKMAFLHPKYWLFWIGLGFFRLILLLPYPLLLKIGSSLGWLFSKLSVGKKRAAIARRNLELCFPEKTEICKGEDREPQKSLPGTFFKSQPCRCRKSSNQHNKIDVFPDRSPVGRHLMFGINVT